MATKHLTAFRDSFPWNAARPDGARCQLYAISDELAARVQPFLDLDGLITGKAGDWLRQQCSGYNMFIFRPLQDGPVIEAITH